MIALRSVLAFSAAASLTVAACGAEDPPYNPFIDGDTSTLDVPDGTDWIPDTGDIPVDGPFSCIPLDWGCYGNTYYQCAADGLTRTNETPCASVCDENLGCVLCHPGNRMCTGNVSMYCAADGQAWVTGRNCDEWGSVCDTSGYCGDACGDAEESHSYVGCEYWPVALPNTAELDPASFDYRVVVANPNDTIANVKVTRGGTEAWSGTVPTHGLTEIILPWVDGLSFGIPGNTWNSIVVADGSYRLTSDLPITAMQFNPFEYNNTSTAAYSYTNDATLLLPAHVLTGDYVGATYVPFSRATGTTGIFPTGPDFYTYPDYIAVSGITPEPTNVTVMVAGNTVQAPGRWADTPRGSNINFTLARGEVAIIAASAPPGCTSIRPGYMREEDCTAGMCDYLDTCREVDYDLTGSRIIADQPVQVFGGHVCAYVPYTSQACDHLEEQLFPIQTWGKDFVSTPMIDAGTSYPNLVRVVAAFDGTVVTVDPPQDGVSIVSLPANQYVEFFGYGAFHVTGSYSIEVAQFILGQYFPEPDAARGDPALTVLVPYEQYRSDYIFIAPSSYNAGTNGQNYVMIVRPGGLPLTLDGTAVTATWTGIAGFEVGIVPIEGGTHFITGAEEFGMVTYGLGSFTSYASPTGLNLEQITIII